MCYSSGRDVLASNLFHRIEHAVPFVSAHDTISEEAPSQAWSGKRRMCSPGLACDPSSIRRRASTARLTAAVQGLQGPGSRPVPLRVAHDPDRPTADLRPTLRCETPLTWRCELRAAPSTWLRRARAFACLACASRGWPGSIPKASSDLRSGRGVWILMAVLGLRRGARSGELRRGSCTSISFVHGSQILRNLCPLSVLKPHFLPLFFPNSPEYSRTTTSVKAVTAVFVRSKRERTARASHSPRTQRWQQRDC